MNTEKFPPLKSLNPSASNRLKKASLILLLAVVYGVLIVPIFIIATVLLAARVISFKNFTQKLGFFGGNVKRHKKAEHIWIHLSSVGEWRTALPLIEALRKTYPHYRIALTYFNEEMRKITADSSFTELINVHAFMSLENPPATWCWIRAFNVKMLIIIETEIWPIMLLTAHTVGLPIVLASGVLFEKEFDRLRRLRWVFTPIVRLYTRLLVTSEEVKGYFGQLGVLEERIKVVGSLKMARPAPRTPQSPTYTKHTTPTTENGGIVLNGATPTNAKQTTNATENGGIALNDATSTHTTPTTNATENGGIALNGATPTYTKHTTPTANTANATNTTDTADTNTHGQSARRSQLNPLNPLNVLKQWIEGSARQSTSSHQSASCVTHSTDSTHSATSTGKRLEGVQRYDMGLGGGKQMVICLASVHFKEFKRLYPVLRARLHSEKYQFIIAPRKIREEKRQFLQFLSAQNLPLALRSEFQPPQPSHRSYDEGRQADEKLDGSHSLEKSDYIAYTAYTAKNKHLSGQEHLPGQEQGEREPLERNQSLGRHLFLDTFGELALLFEWCDCVVLGGTFIPIGGHNVLEPLRAGIPTIVGPYRHHIGDLVESFKEIQGLIVCEQLNELDKAIGKIEGQYTRHGSADCDRHLAAYREKIAEIFNKWQDVTERTVNEIGTLL